MTDILELGVDINKDWSFTDGDLDIVKYNDNIIQSIMKRLNTLYDSFDFFYNNYGSYLLKYEGWRRNNNTLRFMEMEIINTLSQDPRLQEVTVNLSYGVKGTIDGELTISIDEDTDLSLSMVLTNDGVVVSEDIEEE